MEHAKLWAAPSTKGVKTFVLGSICDAGNAGTLAQRYGLEEDGLAWSTVNNLLFVT